MRWPIRNQILVPFAMMQLLVVVVVTTISAWMSIRSVEKGISSRIEGVLDTLEASSYPLTPTILDHLHKLSGVHLAVYDESERLLGATLELVEQKVIIADIPNTEHGIISQLPTLVINQETYFAGAVYRKQRAFPEKVLILYPEQRWQEARTQAILIPVYWGGIVLFLTLLTSAWIARRIAARIRLLQQQVSRISDGDYQPVPIGPINDELRDLSESVSRMSEALKISLKQARDNERAMMLARLASGLAHHLRNALTGARVSIQLHQRRCSNGDDEAVQVALAELSRTEEHMKALLRVSQGEVPTPRPAPLKTIVSDVNSLITPLCKHHDVDFQTTIDLGNSIVKNSDSIRSGLLNLLTNAIEAAGPHGSVQLIANENNGIAEIQIIDNGPGIPDNREQEIFHPFVSTKSEGIGIGLPVAKQAAEQSGGHLTVKREKDLTVFSMAVPIFENIQANPSIDKNNHTELTATKMND